MTMMAVRMLIERIEDSELSGERRLLPAELKLRGSTRVPRP